MLITPSHCRQVSVVRTDRFISNDERALKEMALSKKVYETTRYVLVGNQKQGFAILEVKKEAFRKTFQRIVDVDILALAHESICVVDPEVDVLNPNQMIPLTLQTFEKTGKRAVIVFGKYGHVNFAVIKRKPKLDRIVAMDVVPPRPGKLKSMIRDIIKVGLLDKAVDIEVREINLIELARKAKDKGAEIVVFPCESSGVTLQLVSAEVHFLDRDLLSMLKKHEKLGLVGCDVSFEVLRHLLGKDFDESKIIFEQMCPKKVVLGKQPFITKCCKLREGYEPVTEKGKLGVVVPWGAKAREIADALNWLLDAMARDSQVLQQ